MKYLFLFTLIYTIHLSTLFAQITTFNKIIDTNEVGNNPEDVIVLPDSTYIITIDDFCGENADWHCTVLVKIDADGAVLWSKNIKSYPNGIGGAGVVGSTVLTKDGGIAFVGDFYFGEERDYDIILYKLSAEGDSLWMKSYGGKYRDLGRNLVQLADGSFVFSGISGSYGDRDGDAILMKTDSLGNLLWTRTYGGDQRDEASFLAKDMDGGFILSGYTYSYTEEGNNAYIIKTDSLGLPIWERNYGTQTGTGEGCRVIPANEGGYWLTSTLDTTIAIPPPDYLYPRVYYFAKLDKNGLIEWKKEFMQSWLKDAQIRQLKDGNILLVGFQRFRPDFSDELSGWLVKVDPLGEIIWERNYVYKFPVNEDYTIADGYFKDAKESLDGGFIVTGPVRLYKNEQIHVDSWVLKLDAEGCLEANCGNEIILAIEESPIFNPPTSKETTLVFYPQPSQQELYLRLPEHFIISPNTQIHIYDLHARLLWTQAIHSHETRMVLALESGLFVAQLVVDGRVVETRKIVVGL